jgi:hypothetical protein
MARVNEDLTLVITSLTTNVARQAQREEMLAKRRAEKRYALNITMPASMGVVRDASRFRVEVKLWAINISKSCLGVLADRPIPVNSMMTISLAPFDMFQYVVPVKVVFCAQLTGSMHRIGLRFVPDAPETLHQMTHAGA